MASGTWNWYGNGALHVMKGNVDLDTDTLKVALTTSSYTPNKDTDDYFDDVTNEVSGTGYTAGGDTVTNAAVTYDATSDQARLDFDNPEWTGATISNARTAVLYKSRGGASSADELVAYCTFDADVSVSAGTLTLTIDSDGALAIDVT